MVFPEVAGAVALAGAAPSGDAGVAAVGVAVTVACAGGVAGTGDAVCAPAMDANNAAHTVMLNLFFIISPTSYSLSKTRFGH